MPEILTSSNLKSIPCIRHGFYTREWGSCGLRSAPEREQNILNRQAVAAHLGIQSECFLSCDQVHSSDVVTVTAPWDIDERPKADAMVTRERGIALGILTADCVPLLLVDPEAEIIGAAHAGWRGAVSGIIENTVAAMEKLGAIKSRIKAAIGPCIWQDSYEVGPEFPAPFIAQSRENSRFFRDATRTGHFMFDLPAYADSRLRAAGITIINSSPADTCVDEARFFSFRRNTLRRINQVESLVSAIILNVRIYS
jgi:YfiH family protein